MSTNKVAKKKDLFVGSLPNNTTEAEVRELYKNYGPIISISVQESSGKYAGTKRAFVRFMLDHDASKAAQETNGMMVGGHRLKVYVPVLDRDEYKKKFSAGPGGDASSLNKQLKTSGAQYGIVSPPSTPLQTISSKAEQIMTLSEMLIAVCPTSTPVVGRPQMNGIYGTIFSEDQMWYRCSPVEYVSETQVKVNFIDYGNTEVKNDTELVELNNELLTSQQGFAQHCLLHGVLPVTNDSTHPDFQAGLDYFKQLTVNKQMEVKLHFTRDQLTFVEALVDGSSVNDEMLRLNFVTARGPPQQASNSKPSLLGMPPQPFKSNNRAQGLPSRGAGSNQDQTAQGQLEEQLHVAQREIGRLRNDLESMRQERQSLFSDLSSTKGKLKVLQSEFNNINLTNKLKGVLAKVTEAKKYRLLFPTDSDVQDHILSAIELTGSKETRIRLDEYIILIRVNEALGVYNLCQEEIRQCPEALLLSPFLSARDEARKTLHEMLEKLVESVAQLPITERCQSLRKCIHTLKSNYGNFLDYNTNSELTIENCLPIYTRWKSEKNEVLSSVRTRTNTRHNAVESALRLLQQQLSLDLKSTEEQPVNPNNLDHLVSRLNADISDEIECSNMEKCGSDAVIIASTLKCLLSDMQDELKDIEKLAGLLTVYKELLASLDMWLTKKPDVSTVQVARKTIKGLKSKLRHKLADKQDLEDSESSDQEGLDEVRKELTGICRQLHKAFLVEDEQLAEISHLWRNHFPEMRLQYPDLALYTDGNHEGLVKSGRDLDQYIVEQRFGKDKNKNVIKTVFNGKLVVLKEFIVDGAQKEEFLNQVVAYSKVPSDNLLPVEFLFFLKNGCQVYVQHPYLQKLTDVMKRSMQSLSNKEKYDILCGVLFGLSALHEASLVHGAIHPENVFVREGRGVVGDYDFRKSATERNESGPTMDNGLKFVSPEVTAGSQAVEKTDMFNFGLLVLWVNYPSTTFELKGSGIPDVSIIGEGEPLLDVVRNLLVINPSMRASTADLKKMAYFTERPDSPELVQETPVTETLQLRRTSPPPLRVSSTSPVSILKNSGSSATIVSSRASPSLTDNIGLTNALVDTSPESPGADDETVAEDVPSVEDSQVVDGALSDASSCSLLDEAVPSGGETELLTPILGESPKEVPNLAETKQMIDEAATSHLSESEGLSSKTSSFELLSEEGPDITPVKPVITSGITNLTRIMNQAQSTSDNNTSEEEPAT